MVVDASSAVVWRRRKRVGCDAAWFLDKQRATIWGWLDE
jgi:hypothetical protein